MMDPDANIAEQRRIAARILRAGQESRPINPQDPQRLAELVGALDEWIRHGGFLPEAWDRRRTIDREAIG